jgi:hypothetical protein
LAALLNALEEHYGSQAQGLLASLIQLHDTEFQVVQQCRIRLHMLANHAAVEPSKAATSPQPPSESSSSAASSSKEQPSVVSRQTFCAVQSHQKVAKAA